MEPRLKNSNKWSAVPTEITDMISRLLQEQFSDRMEAGGFVIDGRIYPSEVILRIGHCESGSIRQNNFEGSMEYKAGTTKVVDCIQHLFEATSSMLEAFLADPETEFPMDWGKYEMDETEVFLRYSTVNSSLENEADKLLGETVEESLINQSSEAELEDLKSVMGIAEEEVATSTETSKGKTVH